MGPTATLETPVTGPYTQPLGLFINNEFVEGVEGKRFECINPSTEQVITAVCEATEKDVDIAVAAARKAFDPSGPWRQMSAADRRKILTKLADLMEAKTELLAAVETLNNGKAFTFAKMNVAIAVDSIRYFAGWADKLLGTTVPVSADLLTYVRKEPIGVCGQIIPWNAPLMMLVWKMTPALAAGNVVVMKSAEQTPLTALLFCELVIEAGFPPGVFNLLSGFGETAGAAMTSHMDIDKIAFTGSTETGRSIMAAAASSNLKNVTLELGGKSPNIVFNDADIPAALQWANLAVYFDQGQLCSAGSRMYIQEGVYDEFLAALKKQVLETKIGDGFDAATYQGPQVSEAQFNRVMGYIQSAKEEGATLECGGYRVGNRGYFIAPAIFTNVRPDMKIAREEVFGPVSALFKFKTEEEVIQLANDTVYGLAAGVHTRDINTAIRVSNAIRAGTVWVNCYHMLSSQMPFGGFKQSGIGREMGESVMANYVEEKSVIVKIAPN